MFWLALSLLVVFANAAPDVGYWLAGSKGNYYLIGKGQENWINAREYCLHRNSDLMSVDNEDSLTWLLQHFMPSPEMPGMVQVGLYRSYFPEWKWLSGKLLEDMNKIKVNGTDQCATLKLMDATYVSVSCTQVPDETTRFICERSASAHEQQQKSDNGLWSRLETLLSYLGFGEKKEATTAAPSSTELPGTLEDPGALAKDIEHAERLLELEASGHNETHQVAHDNLLPLPETEEKGSGADISKELTGEGSGEGSGHSWTEEQTTRAEELENDFNTDDSHVNVEDVPVPPKKDEDCAPLQPLEETVERLTTLRKFLNRAGHADLQRLVDDDSNSLFDRLLNGISEANEREFGAVQALEQEKITDSEREMLFDEMSRLLVPDERTRDEAMKMKEDFV